MIYPSDFEHKIDFHLIREQLLSLCTFPIGREEVEKMAFVNDFSEVDASLRLLQEMVNTLSDSSLNVPRCEMYDMRQSLGRIRVEGLFLDEQELYQLRRALDAAAQFTAFFTSLDRQRFPLLSDLSVIMPELTEAPESSLPQIVSDIDRIIDKYGRLRDNASPELAQIRRSLLSAQGAASRALGSVLKKAQAEGWVDRDVSPTMREGRLVIPVPPMNKRKIGGIVHDESATGKTVYIEPQEVVEANNRIRELESEERRERMRVLLQFTAAIRPSLPEISLSQLFLGKVDFLMAKAQIAFGQKAIAPQLSQSVGIDWREARHPVLEARLLKQQKQVVPLSIKLTPEKRILVISGPNAGGKSVCLKTVALLQYMLQCGLLVPLREDSTASVFRNIFIDIGDEQSIEDDLSTYSSHLRNMKHFLRYSNAETLILIDEMGGGTEPLTGGAIAEAVLQKLNESKAMGVVTTHYSNLKHYAEDAEGMVNGAMLYDRGQLRPLFQLSIGQAGSSFALEIAQQTGLSQDIIVHAKELAGEEHIDYERHLQDIARDKRYWEDKRKRVHEREKRLEEQIAEYEQKLAGAKDKRREILENAKQEAEELLRKSNALIENAIRTIKESAADREQTREVRAELDDWKQRLNATNLTDKKNVPVSDNRRKANNRKQNNVVAQPANTVPKPAISEITVGSRVRKRGQTMVGEVLTLTDKQALVAFGSIQSYIPLKQLEYVSARQAKQQTRRQSKLFVPTNVSENIRKRQMQFSQEIDLRGKRADEALTEIINYIDDAVMVGAAEVRILHGTGTGALRQVVRDYLQMQPHVLSYHDAHPDQGGAGITIAELK
ncbi:MAG: Smr/MutS family protein [Paludibacteraceae bacterium]|nr:Smr/MutS family protein [Paludibacteraceae bacterium]